MSFLYALYFVEREIRPVKTRKLGKLKFLGYAIVFTEVGRKNSFDSFN